MWSSVDETVNRPFKTEAGWSSLVARQAHNLKVKGSNPFPASNFSGLVGTEDKTDLKSVERNLIWVQVP